MANIIIKMKDGSERKFLHEGRAGGSYTKRVRYENGFVLIEDEWGKTTAIPTDLISEVEEQPYYY